MASRFEEEIPEVKECGNCGAVDNLLRCSRCRSIYFCSYKCQKAYWPFHKAVCTRNEFADIIEKDDLKFAKWMRKHGKIATLKDDEIERIEKARSAVSGDGVESVMNSMYNKLSPKPRAPSYSTNEIRKMQTVREATIASSDEWSKIDIRFGMNCTTYKWSQNQSHIELYIKLPRHIEHKKVNVTLKPFYLYILWEEIAFMNGELLQEIVVEDSHWFIRDDILHISMLKKSRKGHYVLGQTNADTFWNRILKSSHVKESLNYSKSPPIEYYWAPYEPDDMISENHPMLKMSSTHNKVKVRSK